MKIVLIGYGKMGRTIERVAIERGHTVVARIDIGDTAQWPSADVAIEFTQPESAVGNIMRCLDANLPVVSGTTGWLDQKETVEAHCRKKNGAFFTASNFSPGVNIFFHLNEVLARLMKGHKEYNVSMEETHHTQKRDAPSGTAITLAEGIVKNNPSYTKWSAPENVSDDSIAIRSLRVDPEPGTHAVKYHSAVDDIEIIHTAHSREGFATGAVLAAEFLVGKTGVFGMADLLKF